MLTFVLCAVVGLSSAEFEGYTPVDTSMSWGIAELNGARFITDCTGGAILRLAPDGSVRARAPAEANGDSTAPRGLCAVGQSLAYADGASREIVFVDPENLSIARRMPAPGPNPQGIAFDGKHLWCADDDEDCLYRMDPRTGEVLGKIPAPSYTPRGIAFEGDKLWVLDSWDLCAYRVDPTTGRVEASVSLPPGRPRALVANDASLLVTLAEKNALVEVPYFESGAYTLSLPVDARLRFACTVRPREGQDAPAGASILVALPRSSIRQSIDNLRPFPQGFSAETDPFGQSVLRWDIPALGPEETFPCGWEADIQVWAIRYHPRPHASSGLPVSVDPAYLRADQYVSIDADPIRALADGLTNLAPLDRLLTLRNRIYEKMSYVRDSRWDPADVVIARGTGSCSEYTSVFAGAARGMGIPVRFAGGSVLRPPEDPANPRLERLDKVWHRWQEVYVDGYGWLPVDSTRDDSSNGPPFRRRNFLAVGPGVLVCSRGPFGEGAALDRDYRRRLLRPEGINAWRVESTALWTLHALTPWT